MNLLRAFATVRHRTWLRPVAALACMWSLAGTAWTAPANPTADRPAHSESVPLPKPDFAPNLPLVFLQTGKPLGSAATVPASLRILLPKTAPLDNPPPLTAQVRYHGATSQGYPKKSLALTLDTTARLLDLRKSSHWVLQAAYVDRSLMRHKLSYDLFLALSSGQGTRVAAASRFVELYLDGQYHGAYLLMERVDRRLFGWRAYGSNEVAHACLYKAVDHAANFAQTGHADYEQREPDASLHPYWEPLDAFNQFVNSAAEAEFLAPQTGIAARLDLENAMDFHLLVLLTSNSDGITKNYFFGRDGQVAGPVRARFVFAPWDYDATFGRNWDGTRYPSDVWLSNHLFDRLLQNAGYRARFAARWRQLRQGAFSVAALHRRMDENVRMLGGAVRRNAARWPTDRGGYPDALTFEQDLAQMKAWVEARVRWLDAEIQNLAKQTQ